MLASCRRNELVVRRTLPKDRCQCQCRPLSDNRQVSISALQWSSSARCHDLKDKPRSFQEEVRDGACLRWRGSNCDGWFYVSHFAANATSHPGAYFKSMDSFCRSSLAPLLGISQFSAPLPMPMFSKTYQYSALPRSL